jgi:hypothetical protein
MRQKSIAHMCVCVCVSLSPEIACDVEKFLGTRCSMRTFFRNDQF